MKIAFISNRSPSFGSFRIPFINYRQVFEKQGISTSNNIDNTTDFCFFFCGEGLAYKFRNKFPSCKFIGVKPHFEANIFPPRNFNILKYLAFLFRFFRPLHLNPGFQAVCDDVNCCDLLLADSRRLLRFFSSSNHDVYFLRLLEPVFLNSFPTLPQSSDVVNITYHGNPFTLMSSIEQITVLFNSISREGGFNFIFVTNLQYIDQSKFSQLPGSHQFFEYSQSTLSTILSKTHIGLVPEIQLISSSLRAKLLKLFSSNISQPNADVLFQKFSSNAGRAYIFAQHGIPFVSTSTEEILLDFPKFHSFFGASLCFEENKPHLENLLTNTGYVTAQHLMAKDLQSISLENESRRFLGFLQTYH